MYSCVFANKGGGWAGLPHTLFGGGEKPMAPTPLFLYTPLIYGALIAVPIKPMNIKLPLLISSKLALAVPYA